MGPKSSRWTELSDTNVNLENEELILRNTFLNAQMGPLVDISNIDINKPKTNALVWRDEKTKIPLTEENLDEDDLVNLHNPPPI
jgi:hypothetical protein